MIAFQFTNDELALMRLGLLLLGDNEETPDLTRIRARRLRQRLTITHRTTPEGLERA